MQSLIHNVVNLRVSKSDDKLREAYVGGSVSSSQVSSRKDLPKFEHILPTDGALDEDVNLSSSGRIQNDMQKDEKAQVIRNALVGQGNLLGVASHK